MDYLILAFPILGVALYFLVGLNGGTKKMKRRYDEVDEKLFKYLGEGVKNPDGRGISEYIRKYSGYPVYENTEVKYFDEAIKGLDSQLHDLALAKDFIFMEYHAIEDKEAWQKIQTVLEERVKAGVEVRVFMTIWDRSGSSTCRLPKTRSSRNQVSRFQSAHARTQHVLEQSRPSQDHGD